MRLAIDILGWCGAFLLLLAYALLSARRLEGHSARYQGMNIVGSFCLLLNTAYRGAFPSSFVNLIWILIATWALLRIAKHQPRHAGDVQESAARKGIGEDQISL